MQTFHKKENVHVDISKTHFYTKEGRVTYTWEQPDFVGCHIEHFIILALPNQFHPGWQFQWLLNQFAKEFYPLSSVLYIQLSAWYFLCNILKAPQNWSKLMIFSLFPKLDSWVIFHGARQKLDFWLLYIPYIITKSSLLYFLNTFLICSFVCFHHLSFCN